MDNEKKYLPDKVTSYERLREIFEEFNIDSEKTRFYIGKDYTEPKAFVIYQDDFDDYVVYKMKADGSRALRYKGKDEAYAVNEYYQKFLEEVRKRPYYARKLLKSGSRVNTVRTTRSNRNTADKRILIPVILACALSFIIVPVMLIFNRINHRHDGYYTTPHGSYYYQGHDVYYYDNDWYYYGTYDSFDDFTDDYDYYDTYYYNDDYTDFSSSDYYDDDWESSSWDDDDSGWDSSDSWDSWDSGGSDWDSDW